MNIEIFPLDKVVFDGVPVCLGMEQSAFDIEADELVELLKQKNAGDVMD